MKYDRADSFKADYKSLPDAHKKLFKEAVLAINDAFARHTGNGPLRWPARLRIKDVEGTPGVWEMTWSFSGPDGRAMFDFYDVDGQQAIRWRRIGDHSIFKNP